MSRPDALCVFMVHDFIGHFEQPIEKTKFRDYPRIGDFILDSEEKNLVREAMGGDIVDDTRTSYVNLIVHLFNIRGKRYFEALNNEMNPEKVYSFSDKAGYLFYKHYSGKSLVVEILTSV